MEGGELSGELPELNEKAWRRIHKQMQEFFDKCEVVGWVLDIPGNTLEVTREMEEVHRRNFSSRHQFFFLMDSLEREEAFYTWKDGRLTRKEGYFIYYEKNPQMQEYMISKRESVYGDVSRTEEATDQAASHYREMMSKKKENSYKKRTSILSYLTSVLMVIVLCTVSVMLLGNIRRMDHMEQTISVMSVAMEATEQEKESDAEPVAVETISGNVLPIEDSAQTQQEEKTQKSGEEEQENNQQEKEKTKKDVSPKEAKPEEEGQAAKEEPKKEKKEKKDEEADALVLTEAEAWRAQGYYIVQAGDSLRGICFKVYQTDSVLPALCEANGIEDEDYIFVGQKIVLP